MIGKSQDIINRLQDKEGVFTCKEYKPIRNNQQNARYWVILTYVANETGNDKDILHELMKKKYLSKRKLVKLNGKKMWSIEIKSTTKLNTKEFSEYNNKVEGFFADYGVIMPHYNSIEYLNLVDSLGLN